ncbi:cyclohexyl-isocyanide hydratase [Marchantia polymorpha subsp. ruderalis]|uniref:DJ-1/PfpI domain-containing protein n=2 Tax=Marchantia polymorpha TaxID=3197 RepID=A0A176WHU2_MARPO|nr:hypothetical protein AXG93_4085s1190 [Marchantia polymorpha subsp. ruderalis]PTQ37760.1 hypothetical protein MARPO_0055s0039 [Marchantia polymorpha]BBN03028.1 hypothetical protein Mp_2g20100 [Marchantia polymorpha subsp. ruderalis]|eukprot:PTQ37760.1 hypothetical protein MARPO_0055s0039 [Marchantia polymorpha]
MGRKLQVAVVLFDGVSALDATAPYECLQLLPNTEVVFVSHTVGAHKDALGYLSLNSTHTFHEVSLPDIVIVPGGLGIKKLLKDLVVLDWLQQVNDTTLFTASVGSGSLLLAEAGLLTGLSATTHWAALEALEKQGVKVAKGRVVQQGKIITAAGPTSGIEMGILLASLATNKDFAKSVELILEYDPQPPFNTGSTTKAGAELTAKATTMLYANELKASNL